MGESWMSLLVRDDPALFTFLLPKMKVREVIKLLERDGWCLVKTKGSHRHFKHDRKPDKVTVSGGASEEIRKGTLTASSDRQD